MNSTTISSPFAKNHEKYRQKLVGFTSKYIYRAQIPVGFGLRAKAAFTVAI